MNRRRPQPYFPRGVILTEACITIALVGLVLAVVSLLLTQHARATDYFLNYRRAQLAAESCVERIRAGVLAVADADFTDEAGITYDVRVAEADGAWRPLQRISVTAKVIGKHGRAARYSLSTYVEPAKASGGGGQ